MVRYIHLNPLDGGLVREPQAYPGSSHRLYLRPRIIPKWLRIEEVMADFNNTAGGSMSLSLRGMSKRWETFTRQNGGAMRSQAAGNPRTVWDGKLRSGGLGPALGSHESGVGEVFQNAADGRLARLKSKNGAIRTCAAAVVIPPPRAGHRRAATIRRPVRCRRRARFWVAPGAHLASSVRRGVVRPDGRP